MAGNMINATCSYGLIIRMIHQGRNVHGRVGLFPMNYTTYVKPPTPSETPSTSTSTRSTPATTTSSSVVTPPVSNAHTLEDQIDRAISQVSSTPTSSLVSQPAAPPPLGAPPPAPTNPEAWSIDEVADWLRSVGLENVVDIFIGKVPPIFFFFFFLPCGNPNPKQPADSLSFLDQEITGDILLNLTIDSLKELGIAAYGRRYKVMAAIDKLSTANQGVSHLKLIRKLNGLGEHTPQSAGLGKFKSLRPRKMKYAHHLHYFDRHLNPFKRMVNTPAPLSPRPPPLLSTQTVCISSPARLLCLRRFITTSTKAMESALHPSAAVLSTPF